MRIELAFVAWQATVITIIPYLHIIESECVLTFGDGGQYQNRTDITGLQSQGFTIKLTDHIGAGRGTRTPKGYQPQQFSRLLPHPAGSPA